MKDGLLIVVAALGLLTAIINCLLRKFKWREEPELAIFFEILLSSICIWVAIKVAKLAIMLPVPEVTDEDKVYFCLGSLALIWISLATILRKFKRPPP